MTVPAEPPILELANVCIAYGRHAVVKNVSFDVRKSEFVALLGPSGSGKTTLLRAIAGFVAPSSGSIRLNGEDIASVAAHRRDIGMVFQSYALFPHMTVAGNLRFGLKMTGVPKAEIEARIDEALGYVQLSQFRDRYPSELSGGQQQRVAVARAIAIQPSLLLLDEPMSNLDARLRAEMRDELLMLFDRLALTAIAVTHNQEEALAMADRIVVLSDGQIRQIGAPAEVYDSPDDEFVADFIGDANIIPCRVLSVDEQAVALEAPWGRPLAAISARKNHPERVLLLVRPERLELCSGAEEPGYNHATGTVERLTYMGAYTELRVSVASHSIRVKVGHRDQDLILAAGSEVALRWRTHEGVLVEDRAFGSE